MSAALGIEPTRGALVASLNDDGPAAQAGVKLGDIIVAFDGRTFKAPNELALMVAQTPVGRRVPMKILRQGKGLTFNISVGVTKEQEIAMPAPPAQNFGVKVARVKAGASGEEPAQGVIVREVQSGSTADDAGLQPGDLIREIDQRPIRTIAEFDEAIHRDESKRVLFLIRRGEENLFLAIAPHSRRRS